MRRGPVRVVVSHRRDAEGIPAEIVTFADRYLEGGDSPGDARPVVVNLCRSYRYRSKGFYVSLLADARGQQVVPSVETLRGMADPYAVARSLAEAGIAAAETESADGAEMAETLAFFGTVADARFRAAAGVVYRSWPVPILRIGWVREDEQWKVSAVSPATLKQLSAEERAPLLEALRDPKWVARRGSPVPREGKRASIAVLYDKGDVWSPSSPETIEKLERVAARMNVYIGRIGPADLPRLGEYDALFVRTLTGVSEPAFQFVLRAEALDMPAVDDSQSIIRCSNKVFLDELLRREGIPTPRTRVATPRTPWKEVEALGFPFVVKLPDGSFSAAVHKVASREEFRAVAGEMFRRSPLVIAQEWVPTEWDWRVTVLDGRPLFVAKYYMARGHWQIRAEEHGAERFGRVEAVPRDRAPRAIVELALRATGLIGNGLYGVDIKETAAGPVVIEINDNPNLDIGYDDAADGNRIYEDIVAFFLRRIEQGSQAPPEPEADGAALREIRAPIRRPAVKPRPHHRPFSVAGVELEYAVVDRDLNAVSRVEDAFRVLAGRPVSEVELGAVAFSNEIADHVFEIKTAAPVRSLAVAEEVLAEGVQRFGAVLRREWDARLLPTGMHPWLDPRRARLWTRSNARIYRSYARLFDTRTHGWMNVHAAHLNLPLGREREAVAMLNAAALLIPYLPALAASSPMHDGELQPSADGRLAWILEHQARIPESCGQIVPEYVDGFADYRKRILAPMYAALDAVPDSAPLRHEFFNTRGAILRFGRRSMEIRVLDTQECVRLDIAVAVFVRAALRHLARRVATAKQPLPPYAALVADFRACIRDGSEARVAAPHLDVPKRDADGTAGARDVLDVLLEGAHSTVASDEAGYLELVERMIATGTLSERIRAALEPHTADDEGFTEAARRLYIELMDCLEANEPWRGRGM